MGGGGCVGGGVLVSSPGGRRGSRWRARAPGLGVVCVGLSGAVVTVVWVRLVPVSVVCCLCVAWLCNGGLVRSIHQGELQVPGTGTMLPLLTCTIVLPVRLPYIGVTKPGRWLQVRVQIFIREKGTVQSVKVRIMQR